MSYLVVILRTRGQLELPLTEDEVQSAVAGFKYLNTRKNSRGLVEIVGADNDDSFVFTLIEGQIVAKNPSHDHLQLLIDLARTLDARVRGDEMETYCSPTETFLHEDDCEEINKIQADVAFRRKRARLSQLRLNLILFSVALLLVIVVSYFSRP